MHEYSLMHDAIDAILAQFDAQRDVPAGGRVREVHMAIGALDIHSEDSFQHSFAAITQGTPLEGARLRLTIVPGTLRCACGYHGPCPEGQGDGHDPSPVANCPQCGALCQIQGGRGISNIELGVE